MRLTRITALCAAAALAWACGDGNDSDERPARPAPPSGGAAPPASEPAEKPAAPAAEPAPAEPAAGGGAGDATAGKTHYTTYCATCHGESGVGDGPGAQGLPVSPRNFAAGEFKFDADGNGTAGEDEDLRLVIANGAAAYGGSALMTPWAGVLDEQAISDVVAYVRSLEK